MDKKKALLLALLAQVLWGILPLYWKILAFIPPYQILAQRMVWSLVMLHLAIYFIKGRGYSRKLIRDRSHWRGSALGGIFVTANWFIYIWAVNSGFVLESSLGYYILPLMTGLLALLSGEKLRRVQWVAYGLAAVGVVISTLALGRFPWVALLLSGTFTVFTYLKRESPLDSLDSLYTETLFVAPVALIFLVYWEFTGQGISGNFSSLNWLLLSTTGIVTALPLLLFGYGAKELSLNINAFIQYISPSFTFLLGVFVFKEEFDLLRLASFVFIWLGVLVFTRDQIRRGRKKEA
ncbi:MAG: EamA family transporter RarD [Tissierellia bacterium]|nr:EamA family transporter RarD [Tissierellia bacterium]